MAARTSSKVNPWLFLKLKFRIMANNHLLYVENYKNIFSEIKFEDLVEYPKSFLFENCEKWNEIIQMITDYTKKLISYP